MVTAVTQAIVPSPMFPDNGWERSHRESFSIKEKREYVYAIDILVEKNISRRNACSILGLHPIYYMRFKRVIAKVDALENIVGFVPHNTNGTAHRVHPERPSLLSVIKDDLSRFIFEKRQWGIQVSTCMVRQEACRLLPSFKNKSMEAKKKVIMWFTKQLGLTHHAAMHTAQKHFIDTQEEEESKHFIAMMKDKISGKDPLHIINMDQTLIP